MKIKNKNIFLVGAVSCVSLFIAYFFYQIISALNVSRGSAIVFYAPDSTETSKEYSSILHSDSCIQFKIGSSTKFGQDVSVYWFNDKYIITIFKIGKLKTPLSLLSFIKVKNVKSNDFTLNETYTAAPEYGINSNNIGFNYIIDTIPSISSFDLNFSNDVSIQLAHNNDSIADYYASINNFSISIDNSNKNYIYGKIENNLLPGPITTDILFLKHKENIYVIVMAGKYDNEAFPQNKLYDIVTSKKHY